MPSNSRADYEVGNRKPPKDNQFKKGQSGNPRGRKRGDIKPIDFKRLLDPELTVTKDGAPKRMTVYEIFLRRLVSQALEEKKMTAIKMLLELFEEYKVLVRPPTPPPAPDEGPVIIKPIKWFVLLERGKLVEEFGLEAVLKAEKELNFVL